jgi:hypothetical protein
MSKKYVSETKAGKSISAWIILNRRNQHVATVRAHYSDGGTSFVNVFNHVASKSAETLPFQSGSAGGYGYDKLTAALRGLEIDGHKLTNHCEVNRKLKDGQLYPRDAKAPKGFHFANWVSSVWKGEDKKELPKDKQGYSDCYRESGLKYLEAIGYKVISAI